jgi:cbb3-type cytochrome oxidase subunit 1
VTKPYLVGRTVGGVLMLGANVIFAYHYWLAVRRHGKQRLEPAWSDRLPRPVVAGVLA